MIQFYKNTENDLVMTLQELKSKVNVKRLYEYGFSVTICYRNKKYSCFSNNNFAYQRISLFNETNYRVERFFYTLKNAYFSFYDECKAKNGFKISKN